MVYTPDLAKLLTAGARYADGQVTYVIEEHSLGEVVLPTGQVVGCDPLVFAEAQPPFTVTTPPGTYALRAWVAVLCNEDGVEYDRRVAALELVVREEPATRWELGLAGGQDPDDLGGDDYFGYGVDAGTGTLADLTAVRAVAGWDYDQLEDVFIPADLPQTPVPGVVMAVADQPTGANVVAVSSGWGDGVYPTFVGYTSCGQVASFVTDFMVVPEGSDDRNV